MVSAIGSAVFEQEIKESKNHCEKTRVYSVVVVI